MCFTWDWGRCWLAQGSDSQHGHHHIWFLITFCSWEVMLCIVQYFAASLASSHKTAPSPFQLWGPKMFPGIVKYTLRGKNHRQLRTTGLTQSIYPTLYQSDCLEMWTQADPVRINGFGWACRARDFSLGYSESWNISSHEKENLGFLEVRGCHLVETQSQQIWNKKAWIKQLLRPTSPRIIPLSEIIYFYLFIYSCMFFIYLSHLKLKWSN